MKTLLIVMLTLASTSIFATPLSFTCDSHGPLGLGMLSRIEFEKKEGNQYLMTVYKEIQSGCCRQLRKDGESLVSLIESPTRFGTFVSPDDETYLDISISLAKKKCKIQGVYSGGARLRHKGKLIDWTPAQE